MSLYKGYAQQRGFDPVKVPMNEADKIRQQGLRALGQMKENFEFERKQAKQLADALQDNSKFELKLFNQQTKDHRAYGELLHKARLQNLQVSIDDAKRKAAKGDQTLNNLKAIANFAQSAGAAYQQIEGQRRKNIDTFASEAVINYGLTFKELQILKNSKGALLNSEAELQGVIKDLENRGVPKDVISRLSRSSGYQSYALGKQQAMIRAQGYRSYLAKRSNDEVELADGSKRTLNSAVNEPEILPVILSKLRKEYLHNKDGDPYFKDRVISDSGAAATFRAIDAEWQQRSDQKRTDEYDGQKHEALIAKIIDLTGNAGEDTQEIIGAKGLFDAIKIQAGPPPGPDASKEEREAYRHKLNSAQLEVKEAAISGLKSRAIPWGNVQGLATLMVGPGTGIDVPGLKGGKAVLAQRHFRKFTNEILDTYSDVRSLAEKDLERVQTTDYIQGTKFTTDVYKYINSGERNAKVIKSLTSKAWELAKGDPNHPAVKAAQRLQTYSAFHRTNANDKASLAYLEERARNGYIPTETELETYNLSPQAHAQALEIRQQVKGLIPQEGKDGTRERINNRVTTTLEGLVKKKIKDTMSKTWNDQRIFATNQVNRWYMSYLQKKGNSGDHEGAYKYAIGMLEGIATIDSKHPDWEIVSVEGQYEFKRALVGKTDAIEIGRDKIGEELNADPGLVFKKEYLDRSDVLAFSGKVNRGRSPALLNRATLIESITEGRVLAVDTIQAQLQMYRNKEIAETGASDIQLLPDSYIKQQREIQHYMGPNGCHLANSWDLVDINKACMSQKEDGTIGNPAYISQVIANKAVIETKVRKEVEKTGKTLDINSFEGFMLNSYTNFLDKDIKSPQFNGDWSWRHPALMHPKIAEDLFNAGFYVTVPLPGV